MTTSSSNPARSRMIATATTWAMYGVSSPRRVWPRWHCAAQRNASSRRNDIKIGHMNRSGSLQVIVVPVTSHAGLLRRLSAPSILTDSPEIGDRFPAASSCAVKVPPKEADTTCGFRTLRIATVLAVVIFALGTRFAVAQVPGPLEKRSHIQIRGIYGGVPTQIFDRGSSLEEYGVNAIWVGSGSVTRELVDGLKARSKGLKVFAEFNTMHEASYLTNHPDARTVGPDGKVAPAPDGWQGVCPTHPGYRRDRMDAFRRALRAAPIDGIWLERSMLEGGLDLAKVAADVANDVGCVGQETDVTGVFDHLELRAEDSLRKGPLSRGGDDDVAQPGQYESRYLDSPQPIRNVERFEQSQSSSHHALIRLPDSVRDKINQGAGFGFHAVEKMEELVDEAVISRERKAIEHLASDRRTQRRAETSLGTVHDEPSQTMRVLDGHFQRDRPAKRDAENRGTLQAEKFNDSGEVVSVLADVGNAARIAITAPRGAITTQPDGEDLEIPSQSLGEREHQFPASGQPRNENDRVALTQT